MNEPDDFSAMDGRKVPLNMSVDYISFSAHVDFTQNAKFIDDVKAPHVVSIRGNVTVGCVE
jgi:cleavage and polyadenylation specificity factor subunit 3